MVRLCNNGVVAIIPTRGGSKGIPQKNIQKLDGKPLMAYSIEAALESNKISRVIVSTDDPKIAKIAKKFGAEVPFLRPKELAQDDSPTYLALQSVVKYLENVECYSVTMIVLIQPTSPLRKTDRIDETIEKLLKTGADSAATVCCVKDHPCWSFTIDGDRLRPFSNEGTKIYRRQDLPKAYALNGAVYAVRRSVLFEQNTVLGKDSRAVIMPEEESIDIDSYFDFFLAEMVLKNWEGWFSERNKTCK